MDLGAAFRRLVGSRGAVATIDVAATPPLTPLAPVDTSDPSDVTNVLTVAARIGEILVVCGGTNSDAAEQVSAIAQSFGLWNTHVDMTHNRIRLHTNTAADRLSPITVVRVIHGGVFDFYTLRQVDKLIRDIHTGAASLREAQRRLDAITSAPPWLSTGQVAIAWAVMGAAVALLIGGDFWVAGISMIAGISIVGIYAYFGRIGLPIFFQNVLGGILAAMLAAGAYHLGNEFDLILRPSMVIASSIIAMLAGLTLVQAIQNGVTFAPVTGNARFFDTIIITGGIVAGVGIGIELSAYVHLPLPPMETVAVPNFSSTFVRVLGGACASAAFARASYADWPSVFVSGLSSLLSSALFYYALIPLGMSDITAVATTAVFIGLAGGLLARHYQIPPVIVSVAGVTPLLPGLAIYRGMYGLLHEQVLVGFGGLTLALATATALSAGVVFGEWIARRLRAPWSMQQMRRWTAIGRFKRGRFY
ncbi:threonine/serine exporter ThrE [Corynebacterium sp. HS2168-gen11]|uniref:threonine/serine exporter ThrE n=1 Tax=Corynebacterium sp. HS2168-gen11 TaxID=2974027 RepID=UPI00216B0EB8|nr:threonine/serine exporter family protein [Corynebacterium sp. HS2168-gen11]MCS4536078.1 threonine/serine exporter family protein [Corynebacterium sp. HS2168-gen11]